MSNLIGSAGYEVETFNSAEHFLSEARPAKLDCVISDVQTQGMSGIELLAAIRAGPSPPPVLMMTGRLDPTVREQAIAGGAVDIFSKPFDDADLIPGIEQTLSSPNRQV